MGNRKLEEAMRMAAAFRQLRDVEMDEARRWRAVFGRASDDNAREFMARHIAIYIATARKWNRQLLLAQRTIRAELIRRQFCRNFVPQQAVRP